MLSFFSVFFVFSISNHFLSQQLYVSDAANLSLHLFSTSVASYVRCPVWGRGTPLPPVFIYFLIFSPFHFSLSFIGFTYFLLLSIPSLSTRVVPLRFQARDRRRRPNLVLVCFLFCTLCYLYSLVKMYCGALFY